MPASIPTASGHASSPTPRLHLASSSKHLHPPQRPSLPSPLRHEALEYLLDCLEITSEHEALEAADREKAAMHMWRRKASQSHSRSPWSVVKDLMESDKNVVLASRAEDVLLYLKQSFPGLVPDHTRRQQDPVQQGCWASNPGEQLEGAGEPGVQHLNLLR